MNEQRARRLRVAFGALALVSILWAAAIVWTGGFVVHVFGVPLTSRNPRNPMLLFAIASLSAWALPMRDRWRRTAEASRRALALAVWPRSEARWLWWAEPAGLVALAFIALDVQIWWGARPFWVDEEMIALNLRDRSFGGLAGRLWLEQSAPFGWLVLERAMLLVFGGGERSLRVVPLLYGCGLLTVAVWVGRRFLSPWGAGLFVLLSAVGRWPAHYRFELKHYSADAFWGLLLPVLALWVARADRGDTGSRRVWWWWAVAALGLWMSNGAVLATPACAVILLWTEWRRAGWPAAWRFSRAGLIWLASFGLHYLVSLRHAVTNSYLREYWSAGFPPPGGDLFDGLRWLALRVEPLALNPGGTEWWVAFWISAVAGFFLAGRRIGPVLAAMPFSSVVLGALGIVPLEDRLALWMVPVMYLGIATFVEGAVRQARIADRRPVRLTVAAVAIGLAGPMCADIVDRGWLEYRAGRGPTGNGGTDDRSSVRWLMDQRRAGDVMITTEMGAPGVWWYGAVPIGDVPAGAVTEEGMPILAAALEPGDSCPPDPLEDLLRGRRRVLMHVGFPDQATGFSDVLLARLSRLGAIVGERRFDLIGHAAVVELGTPEPPGLATAGARAENAPALGGCLVGRPAHRW